MAATPQAPAKAAKPKAKKNNTKGRMYELKDGKAVKKNPTCPRCGDGVFLATHKDRVSCGKCGYTEYKK
jgi:small subunit ribosomal protein S27Ae